jgi:hypothetical protein
MTSKEFNWDRKISLKEIAQFYEDRLREPDGKFQSIIEIHGALKNELYDLSKKTSSIVAQIENSEFSAEKIQRTETRIDDIKKRLETISGRLSSLEKEIRLVQDRSNNEEMDLVLHAQFQGHSIIIWKIPIVAMAVLESGMTEYIRADDNFGDHFRRYYKNIKEKKFFPGGSVISVLPISRPIFALDIWCPDISSEIINQDERILWFSNDLMVSESAVYERGLDQLLEDVVGKALKWGLSKRP